MEDRVGREVLGLERDAVRHDTPGKVDSRLHGKGNSRLPWSEVGQPSHLVAVVDSDQ